VCVVAVEDQNMSKATIFWIWRRDLIYPNKTQFRRIADLSDYFKIILVVKKSSVISEEIKKKYTFYINVLIIFPTNLLIIFY